MNLPPPPAANNPVSLRGPVLLWCGVIAALVGYATLSSSADHVRAGGVSESGGTGSLLAALTATDLSVSLDGTRRTYRVSDSGGDRAVVLDRASAGGVELKGPGAFEGGGLRVRERDDGFVIELTGGESYRVKARDEGGYSVRDASGAVLYRAKLKDDKFNIYDGTGARIRAGKAKKGAISVRNDGGTEIGTIQGTTSLKLAAILAMPLPPEVRAAALAQRVEDMF